MFLSGRGLAWISPQGGRRSHEQPLFVPLQDSEKQRWFFSTFTQFQPKPKTEAGNRLRAAAGDQASPPSQRRPLIWRPDNLEPGKPPTGRNLQQDPRTNPNCWSTGNLNAGTPMQQRLIWIRDARTRRLIRRKRFRAHVDAPARKGLSAVGASPPFSFFSPFASRLEMMEQLRRRASRAAACT